MLRNGNIFVGSEFEFVHGYLPTVLVTRHALWFSAAACRLKRAALRRGEQAVPSNTVYLVPSRSCRHQVLVPFNALAGY